MCTATHIDKSNATQIMREEQKYAEICKII